MNIDGVRNGIVLDHITAGRGLEIYNYLGLANVGGSVALLQNVQSGKFGRKDIIKIDEQLDLDLDVLGYLDPNITVNIIKGEKLVEKKHLSLPKQLKNVIFCKNPRCITTTEQEIDHIFELSDETNGTYHCAYCETVYKRKKK